MIAIRIEIDSLIFIFKWFYNSSSLAVLCLPRIKPNFIFEHFPRLHWSIFICHTWFLQNSSINNVSKMSFPSEWCWVAILFESMFHVIRNDFVGIESIFSKQNGPMWSGKVKLLPWNISDDFGIWTKLFISTLIRSKVISISSTRTKSMATDNSTAEIDAEIYITYNVHVIISEKLLKNETFDNRTVWPIFMYSALPLQ